LGLGGALLAAARASALEPEAGVSVFALRHTRAEGGTHVLARDEPTRLAPYVAARHAFNERFALRLSYQFVGHAESVTEYGSPPGSPLAVVVWGHYRDDIHVVSAAPELAWALSRELSLSLAPQVNWVASRGVVSYATTNATVLLVGPRTRREEGFTLGGALRASWSFTRRAALSAGYEYLDLDPSFGRQAHVFSGGVRWKF
jgi:hypothetical protein